MSSLITHGGMLMAVVGAILMAAAHLMEYRLTVYDRHLVVAGVVLFVVGFVLGRRQRHGSWRVRGGRCARCGAKVHGGQIYCEEHAREALQRTRDEVRRG